MRRICSQSPSHWQIEAAKGKVGLHSPRGAPVACAVPLYRALLAHEALVIGRKRSPLPPKRSPAGTSGSVTLRAVLWVQFLVLCEHVNELPNARCTRLGSFRHVYSP